MARRYYFLLTSLPALPVLGEPPPIGLGAFREVVASEPAGGPVVDALLLDYDLVLREASQAGEISQPAPVMLTVEQVRGEAPLPEFLAASPAQPRRIPADAVWEAYYEHVSGLAGRYRCGFARQWVAFEVALRSALVAARAAALKLDPRDYLVAQQLAGEPDEVADVVAAWSDRPDPLSALRALDEGRWRWTQDRARYFSFALDELAAYARKLILVTRWHVLTREDATNWSTG